MCFHKVHYASLKRRRRGHKRKVALIVICAVLVLIAAVSVTAFILRHRSYGKLTCRGGAAVLETSGESYAFDIPEYAGNAYAEINGNVPFFTAGEMRTKTFQKFSALDMKGRCRTAYACLGVKTMATDERGAIGMVRPSGWQTVRYDDLIEDKYLYNRCHLIAYMLSGENANERNLITGTRYMNVSGMLPFEEKVSDYIWKTRNHVMYRVTPCFEGGGLVAKGVLMEARSVEDDGAGMMFNVFVYNVQPGIKIDYSTGKSRREEK